MKQTIKLRESELRRMISESVKRVLRENRDNKKAELEDAIRNVTGILHASIEEDFGGCLNKEELDNLYSTLSDALQKINASYDYGPYEGEPYYFGY